MDVRVLVRPLGIGLGAVLAAAALTSCGPVPGTQTALPATFVRPAEATATTRATTPAPTTPKPTPTVTKPAKPAPPRRSLRVTMISPGPGVYGVGLVISVGFSEPLDRATRRAVQYRLSVTTNKSVGSASWSWTDANTAMFRSKLFWPAYTRIRVSVNLEGLRPPLTHDGVQLVGRGSASRVYTTGRKEITQIDGNTQMGTVYRNNKVIRHVPVSMGKAGWRTRNGIKVFMDREMDHVYTNTAVGDLTTPYRLVGHYNLRLTWSGEFLHSAPWAEGRLGSWPGSHGCTNASDADAGWYYHNALYADPVVYRNTGGPTMELGNGMGGPWNLTWKAWTAASLVPAVPTWRKPVPKPVVAPRHTVRHA